MVACERRLDSVIGFDIERRKTRSLYRKSNIIFDNKNPVVGGQIHWSAHGDRILIRYSSIHKKKDNPTYIGRWAWTGVYGYRNKFRSDVYSERFDYLLMIGEEPGDTDCDSLNYFLIPYDEISLFTTKRGKT